MIFVQLALVSRTLEHLTPNTCDLTSVPARVKRLKHYSPHVHATFVSLQEILYSARMIQAMNSIALSAYRSKYYPQATMRSSMSMTKSGCSSLCQNRLLTSTGTSVLIVVCDCKLLCLKPGRVGLIRRLIELPDRMTHVAHRIISLVVLTHLADSGLCLVLLLPALGTRGC